MRLSLHELIRRGDVCFYCTYHIGDTGRPLCPECGRPRPEPEQIARVQHAIRIGKVGLIALAVAVASLTAWILMKLSFDDPFELAGLFMYCVFLVLVGALVSPWFGEIRRPSGLFLHPWRVRFMAAYPWLLLLGLVALVLRVLMG